MAASWCVNALLQLMLSDYGGIKDEMFDPENGCKLLNLIKNNLQKISCSVFSQFKNKNNFDIST